MIRRGRLRVKKFSALQPVLRAMNKEMMRFHRSVRWAVGVGVIAEGRWSEFRLLGRVHRVPGGINKKAKEPAKYGWCRLLILISAGWVLQLIPWKGILLGQQDQNKTVKSSVFLGQCSSPCDLPATVFSLLEFEPRLVSFSLRIILSDYGASCCPLLLDSGLLIRNLLEKKCA
ncbi:hypothetical protein Q3G72_023080 [Acer saccharum]|nr:hypothetical protein Q3G72_023080 [Acer saccharum]